MKTLPKLCAVVAFNLAILLPTYAIEVSIHKWLQSVKDGQINQVQNVLDENPSIVNKQANIALSKSKHKA